MEAKDTVMKPQQIIEAMSEWRDDNGIAWEDWATVMLTQAEISFKAGIEIGYQRGLAMKPNPDSVYENGLCDGKGEGVMTEQKLPANRIWTESHYHLCPICGLQSSTTSRICSNHRSITFDSLRGDRKWRND